MSWRVSDFIYDLDHAQRYCMGCVFYVDKEPVYVHHVARQGVTYQNLLNPSLEHQTCRLNQLYVDDYPLGYVNMRESLLRVVRIPARIWKYGLNSSGIHVISSEVDVSRGRILTSPQLAKTLLKDFPSLEEAQNNSWQTAFHNHYSAKGENIFYYRWDEPIANWRNGEIEMEKPFAFLKEELSEITGTLCVSKL